MREKEGAVLQSNEVVVAVSVLASFVALYVLGNYMLQMLMNMLKDYLNKVGDAYEPTAEFAMDNALELIKYCVLLILPIAVIISAVAIISVMAQTRGLFSMKVVKPKFSKLNPLTGIKRLFSMQSLVGIVKSIIELVIIGVIVYTQIDSRMVIFGKTTDMEPIQGVYLIMDSVFNIVMLISILLAFIAAADFVFQWWQFEKKLKMSKQEVKDEYKQMEGDPQIKSKIKQKQREIAQQRMMEEVPKADVVVRNPTHFAVALKYEAKTAFSAPVVVAKGQDALAMKIVKIAEENHIYTTENRPLARALYDSVKVGKEIPASLFTAVAEVLSEMYTAKGIKPKKAPAGKLNGARPRVKRNDLNT